MIKIKLFIKELIFKITKGKMSIMKCRHKKRNPIYCYRYIYYCFSNIHNCL